MDFGIWVEPEMVNVDSELYQAHPDWAMDIPGKKSFRGKKPAAARFEPGRGAGLYHWADE